MRRSELILAAALLVSNGAWIGYVRSTSRDAPEGGDEPPLAGTTSNARAPGTLEPAAAAPTVAHAPGVATAPAAPSSPATPSAVDLASAPPGRRAPDSTSPPQESGAGSSGAPSRPVARTPVPPLDRPASTKPSSDAATTAVAREAARVAASRVRGLAADVLQIEDPRRREEGLDAIELALRSPDGPTAMEALRSLYELRDVPYEKSRFRPAVLARLGDPDRSVRGAAAFALMNVAPEPADTERLLDVLESHPPEEAPGLIVAAWLSKNRVEGRLAALYVRALGVDDERSAVSAASELRGMWVTAEVEDAVLAVWRRTRTHSGWNHILGQITPTREPRVRVIFELLEPDTTDAPQLLDRALEARSLDPAAKPLAVELALGALRKAPNSMIRTLMLKVVRDDGTIADAAALRAYAANSMVGDAARRAALEAADAIERRR